jgi:hypothetical protein
MLRHQLSWSSERIRLVAFVCLYRLISVSGTLIQRRYLSSSSIRRAKHYNHDFVKSCFHNGHIYG